MHEMKRPNKIHSKTAAIFAAILLAVVTFFSVLLPGRAHTVSAASGYQTAYEQQNVLTDLRGGTVAGKEFDISEYPFNQKGDPQIVSLIEFGFSAYMNKQDDYALYVYVYNPQGVAFDTNGELNQIGLAANEGGRNKKYILKFLNYSTEAGYEGLFYKFKLVMSDAEKKSLLRDLKPAERVYQVTELELYRTGDAVPAGYKIAQLYQYTGYAQGYGSELATESTLACTVNGFERYVELNVKHTVYRPKGDYYNGQQSQLNSCFFRVPDDMFKKYGALSKIACEWYEYITNPVLVTEEKYPYTCVYNLHGAPMTENSGTKNFLFQPIQSSDWIAIAYTSSSPYWISDIDIAGLVEGGNYTWIDPDLSIHWPSYNSAGRKDGFAAAFYTDGVSYMQAGVSAEQLEEVFLENSKSLGEPYAYGAFSEALFSDEICDGHTRGYNFKEIAAEDDKTIFWNTTAKETLWQKWFGGYTLTTEYDTVKAIVEVTDEDLKGADAVIAENLKIAEKDVAALRAEVAAGKLTGERVVLLRYSDSLYSCMPCLQASCNKSAENPNWDLVKEAANESMDGIFSAYAAQTTVFLGFDIISMKFKAEDNSETEIPVVASPTNAFSGLTPPLEENYHIAGTPWWVWAVLGVIILIILILLCVFVKPVALFVFWIIKGVWWLISAPFRLIIWLVKRRQKNKDDRPEKKDKKSRKDDDDGPPDDYDGYYGYGGYGRYGGYYDDFDYDQYYRPRDRRAGTPRRERNEKK